ncbi:MAG TPA: hypothetical protein VMS21_14740 [Methylomirabilota bacterium]|nr:hypothetical protein [Methylomirabilota bacterium]
MPDRKDANQPHNREAEQERDHANGGEEPTSSAEKPDPEEAAGHDTEDDERDSERKEQPDRKRFPPKKDKPPVTIAPSGGSEPDVII